MKRIFTIFPMCLLLMAGGTLTAETQKAKVAKKVIEIVTKGTKKTTKKTSVVRRTQLRQTNRPRTLTVVKCSLCNGTGKVIKWNSYSQQYYRSNCYKCNGTGKVRHN